VSNQIIDSNFNQATESIKILEDIALYELEAPEIAVTLKALRMQLDEKHQSSWLMDRQTFVVEQTEASGKDMSLVSILRLNAKKAAQALKTIEEFAQLRNLANLALIAENGRLQIYSIERDLWLKLSNYELKHKLNAAQLYFISGRAENEPFESIVYKVKLALAGGVQIVQLREKGLEASQTCYLATQMKELCHKAGALFIVNDRPDIALAVDADGVHVGQGDIDLTLVRQIVGKNRLIGLSAHSTQEIKAALNSECDYISIGPIHLTATKPGRPPIGLELINWAAKNVHSKPWFVVGGISLDNLKDTIEAGAQRFALVKYFMEASDQAQAANLLKSKLPALTHAESQTLQAV
jgi:thiamine-phosphate pyrophosphorylase